MNRLTNEVCLTNGIAGGQTNRWVYDEAGNWRTGDGKWRLYNADNELVGIATSNAPVTIPITVTGEVEPGPNSNKWFNTWASSRGVSAQVSQTDGTFSLADVPLYPATNHLAVTVRDVSGNEARQVRTVSRPFPEMFHYDGNGNLTNWVCGTTNWVYEWDWADRLTKVTSNGVVVLENWYDASSRRIAKKEVVGGQTNRVLYLYDGWDTAGVLNDAGQLRETFTRTVGLWWGEVGSVVAVTHHEGSGTNGVFYAQHNHRGDIVLTRTGTVTVSRSDYSPFGSLKSATGPDVCRFKFSSKERDSSTGFSYYGYRFYAPHWQKWLNWDPLREPGFEPLRVGRLMVGGRHGTSFASLYLFVGNNPLVRTDPIGLDWFDNYTECLRIMRWDLVCGIFGAATPGSIVPRGPIGKICRKLTAVGAGWCAGVSLGCMINAGIWSIPGPTTPPPSNPPYSGGPVNTPPVIIIGG